VSEIQLYQLECELVALLAGAFLLTWVVRRLQRAQPGLAIGWPIAVGFALRLLVALGLSQMSAARALRGGDELTFLSNAQELSHWSFISHPDVKALTHTFHTFFFSLDYRILVQPPQVMIRIEVIAIAVCGLALLAAAVHELAGPRAALIAAWVLALDPANIFFSGILHKEPFMFLAEGLAAYGGARLWKRGDYRALIPMIAGCLIATATRPYVGWFLAAASAVLALHAGMRRNSASGSFALTVVVVGLMVAFFPTVWNASSHKNLHQLQLSQDANATNTTANLSLERVDYSTRGKIIVNLPTRISDVITKPYPWQLKNLSQELGAFGSLFLWALLVLLIWTLLRGGARHLRKAAPILYPMFFLLVAYSLSAGNAGTAFRYRTHIVAFLIALLAVVRYYAEPSKVESKEDAVAAFPPVLVRGSVPTLAK
jgi:hypothetical protein